MPILKFMTMLALTLALGACATPQRLQETRDFAAQAAKLTTYPELTARFRDTYEREKPYLSAVAEQGERQADSARRAAYADLIRIEKSVALYMQTLGMLAGDRQYDARDQVGALGAVIRAWPDSGLDSRHVTAYSDLGALIARMLALPAQESAVQAMVKAGDAPLQALLDAMIAVVRYYDKTNANEKKIVLGLFEVEIGFADRPQDQLLAALAKAHYHHLAAEYAEVERLYAALEKNLNAIAQSHASLLKQGRSVPAGGAALAIGQAGKADRAVPE